MNDIYQLATEVRSNFSDTIDRAIYDRPQFIKRTRDHAILVGTETLKNVMAAVLINCKLEYDKESKNYVLTNEAIEDIIAYGESEEAALNDMAQQLLDYAHEYYEEFGLYSRTPNRKGHLPYVIKALMLDNVEKVKGMIICQNGESSRGI